MSGIWCGLLSLGSNHPNKQSSYKWFVILNLPQRATVKAPNKANFKKHWSLWNRGGGSFFSFFLSFFYVVLIEHVTFLLPGISTLTEGWKQTRPPKKKLAEPFGLSCQFKSEGNGAFSLSERRRGGIRSERGASWLGGSGVGGGSGWGGDCASKAKSSNEARKFHVVWLPLAGYLMVLSAVFVASRYLLGTELWHSICSAAGSAWFLGAAYLQVLRALQYDGFEGGLRVLGQRSYRELQGKGWKAVGGGGGECRQKTRVGERTER